MSWIAQTFDEFGRSIGLPGLQPAGGRLSLELGTGRRLDFHVLEDAVAVLLVRPLEGADRLPTLRRALDACHLRHGWALPVRAGLSRAGDLVFITRLPLPQFRPDGVEQALDLLTRLHARVG
jgi:type III secretion system chaperone SycN